MRAVALRVVESGKIHFARAHRGRGEWSMGIAAILQANHAAGDTVAKHIDGNIGISDADKLIDRVGLAATEIVRQIADHYFVAGALADFFTEGLTNVDFLAVTVGVGFPIFLDAAFFPYGAFGNDNKSVVAGIVALVVRKEFGDAIDVKGIFGNEAASGSDVGGVKGGEAGIATENAENADAFVRAERGALAGDEFLRASDGSREADTVFGALDVVVHGFGNGDDGHAGGGERGRETERVVATDGDKAADAEAFEIIEYDGSEVVVLAVERKFLHAVGGDNLRELGFNHLPRVGARGVEYGAARTIDGARIFAIEWTNVRVGGIGGIHMGKTLPAFADADDGAAELAGAVDYGFDDWVQAGNVAAAGEDGDFIFGWHWDESPSIFS